MTDSLPRSKRARRIRNKRLNQLPLAAAANQPLAYLVKESGFRSLAAFASAINNHASAAYGIQLSHDHNIIRRWLNGAACMHPEIVADVLSGAWGVTIPPAVIWPDDRNGTPPASAHLQPCIAEHTLANLGAFLRRDALREVGWTDPVPVATGDELVNPISRWLASPPVRLTATEQGPQHTDQRDQLMVDRIEAATAHLIALDAVAGGEAARDMAAGQLRYAVDLASHHLPTDTFIRNRLLAAIARLASEVGAMSHDAGLDGTAQQYFAYALQTAQVVDNDHANLVVVYVLTHMAHQMCELSAPQTALRLIELAAAHHIQHAARSGVMQGMLWILRARALAILGPDWMEEINSSIALALTGCATAETPPPISQCRLRRHAAEVYLTIAEVDHRQAAPLAAKAESCSLIALDTQSQNQAREKAYNLINLARSRFLLGRPDEACDDATQAIQLAHQIPGAARLATRIHALATIAERFPHHPQARDLHRRALHFEP
ncbi:tetratricopeptide repeat protein [Micromonospora polyrhachis]|uniref:Transcriptional regulator n=1 Tax=Micromonospora polyrhachis TaxID=1282883 RepID=A0A7W7WRG3_9ACTN|nr:tetratricopeptide repeat protein [Micromonospora polyrhachis]MBB4960273.1 hypothetical protein [Micromonospora polyrhachis]